MTLQQIYYILKTARCGSMNRAAEELFISQPTLSGAIRDAEQELGITIFRRTSKGVILTPEGSTFLADAGHLYGEYQQLLEGYRTGQKQKQKFGVSAQHYSFAVKAFVEMVRRYGTLDYDFALRETKTREVFRDVADGRSQVGIIFRSSYNDRVIEGLLKQHDLHFEPLLDCPACVYLWSGHPLAGQDAIHFSDLLPYPYLAFEQEKTDSNYLSEEILADRNYARVIRVNDRATMLNLMVGLNGYTLCSGIVCEELNRDDCMIVPFAADEDNPNQVMHIGYLTRNGVKPGDITLTYIEELHRSLKNYDAPRAL